MFFLLKSPKALLSLCCRFLVSRWRSSSLEGFTRSGWLWVITLGTSFEDETNGALPLLVKCSVFITEVASSSSVSSLVLLRFAGMKTF